MTGYKFLIDTNVAIGLEDPKPVETSLAEFIRMSSENGVAVFIDGATYDDIGRDRDAMRRETMLSKLAKFRTLRGLPNISDAELEKRFGPIKNDRDRSDVRLLAALSANAADFLVTLDVGLHTRAGRCHLSARVWTVEDALDWLRREFQPRPVDLPYVANRKAYELDRGHPIFADMEAIYPGFGRWLEKCQREHRECWTLEIGGQLAGLIIRKDESHAEASTKHRGPKILKICLFRIDEAFRGEKLGELLLKQALWYAQRNNYDLVYLTVYDEKQPLLVDLLAHYGFQQTSRTSGGEAVMEKAVSKGPLPDLDGDPLGFSRLHYPRFYDGPDVRKFCVPIQPDYYRRLFPETMPSLPLFPREQFGWMLDSGQERTPGNTIKKVYLCRARTNRIERGDVLLFYVSKGDGAVSQALATLGVVEGISSAETTADLRRLTAKRSVFSYNELEAWNASAESPVRVIDFLAVGHLEPAIALADLITNEVIARQPPQSISEIKGERYTRLRPRLNLGFEI